MATARDSLNEDTLLTLSEILKARDENLRALTDISLRLAKLEEDVRINKVTNETEKPALSLIPPQETRLTDSNSQPIKLKDAIVSVPVFDGHRPSVSKFLRAFKRARNMVPRH